MRLRVKQDCPADSGIDLPCRNEELEIINKKKDMVVLSQLKLKCTYKRWNMAEGSGSRYFPRTRITVGQGMLALTTVIRRTLGRK
jgi:hypothetical protein